MTLELRPRSDRSNARKVYWLKTPLYCCVCGQHDVWQDEEEGSGDYYLGAGVECKACKHVMLNQDDYWKDINRQALPPRT